MDLQTGLFSLGLVIVLSVLVYLISVFGIREKTYEEAIAEQRQKNDIWDVSTTNKSSKGDVGAKRNRKVVGRRWKEKGSTEDSSSSSHQHLHVGFKPNAEIIPPTVEVPSTVVHSGKVNPTSSTTKRTEDHQQPKSILVTKKERSSPSGGREGSVTNTTGTTSTKNTREKTPPSTSSSTGNTKRASEEPVVEKKKTKERSNVEDRTVEISMPTTTTTKQVKGETKKVEAVRVAKHVFSSTAVKPAKRPKYDDEALTAQHIQKLLNAAVLSHSEIQSLIDLLLNRQQSNSREDSEWLQPGQKVDPISSLKKQLVEREESLTEEKARAQATAAKLMDVRKELNAEKVRTAQLERSLKERQQELQTQSQRTASDASAQQAKFQQLQAKQDEEHNAVVKKLKEQNQQMSQTIVQIETKYVDYEHQKRESEELVEKLEANLKSANGAIDHLQAEIQIHQESLHILETSKNSDENNYKQCIGELKNQLNEEQTHIAQLEATITKLRSADTEKVFLDRLAEVQKVSSLNEAAKEQLEAEVKVLKQQEVTLREQLALLKAQLQEENLKLIKSDKEIIALRDDNEMLASQLSQLSERQEAEGHEGSEDSDDIKDKTNGHIVVPEENGKETKILLSEHETILHEKEKQVVQLTTEVSEKSHKIQELLNQIGTTKEEVTRLSQEIDTQKKKNNELREKNWKAVDALSQAEKTASDRIKSVERSFNEKLVEIQKTEQKLAQDVLERIFPTVKIDKNVEFSTWVCKFEGCALESLQERLTEEKNSSSSSLYELQTKLGVSEDNCGRLQAEVQHYKTVLAETEGILNKLQSSVEAEELTWREKFNAKEEELDKLREEKKMLVEKLDEVTVAQQTVAEMGSKLQLLQEELKHLDEAKSTLERVNAQLVTQNDQIHALENERHVLSERLKESESVTQELTEERRNNKELSAENVKLSGQLKSGVAALKAEQELVQQLQSKLEECQSPSTNGPSQVSSPTSDYESRCSGIGSDVWPQIPSLIKGDTTNDDSSSATSSSMISYSPLVATATGGGDDDDNSSSKILKKSKSKKKQQQKQQQQQQQHRVVSDK